MATQPVIPTHQRLSRAVAQLEVLEPRNLFNVTLSVGPNVNVSQTQENQNEVTIAVDPTNPNRIFVSAVNDSGLTGVLDDPDGDLDVRNLPPGGGRGGRAVEDGGDIQEGEEEEGEEEEDEDGEGRDFLNGQLVAVSNDAGATWTRRTLGEGDGLTAACCDGSAAFDSFGNLFLTYIDADISNVVVASSTDGGSTFTILHNFPANDGGLDQPTITTGPGSVWVTFEEAGEIVASGAPVSGLGAVGTFIEPEEAPSSDGGNFGDISVGPGGQVTVAYQMPTGGEGPAAVFVNTDPDGLGPLPFGPKVQVTSTNVGGFDFIPAQDNRSSDAEAGLAYDRSGGPFNGRLYMVYTNDRDQDRVIDDTFGANLGIALTGSESGSDFDIFVRFSTDNGATWSNPLKASDAPLGSTQFLPRMAIDQTTGNVGIVFHDTRNDRGASATANDETQFWGTVGVPGSGGVVFAPNVQISTGTSLSERARATLDFGDYTALSFNNGVMYPAWADNSNSTNDNPSGGVGSAGELATLDAYMAKITVNVTPSPTDLAVPVTSTLAPDFIGKTQIKGGKKYVFKVAFQSGVPIDASSIGGEDIIVTGPNGFSASPVLQKVKLARGGTVALAQFFLTTPDGRFDRDDNGQYTVFLREASIRDSANNTNLGGIIDRFFVSSTTRPRGQIVTTQRRAAAQAVAALAAAPAPVFGQTRVAAIDLLKDQDS